LFSLPNRLVVAASPSHYFAFLTEPCDKCS